MKRAAFALLAGAFLGGGVAQSGPWIAPGDEGLRSDIQLLADAGIIGGPVTTWPISWPDVAKDVLLEAPGELDDATSDALARVQRLARRASARGSTGFGARAAAAHAPTLLRDFADTPREEGEFGLSAGWLTDHVAANLEVAAVADPDDAKQVRFDGSYLGVNVANYMISAGYLQRWWGPGWDGSLILSTNARPIPSVTIERNYTDPFKTRLLSWLGPWRASIAVGQAEDHDVAVSLVRFFAARVNFKPAPWLEFGLTRSAQWCGGGRPCGWGTFKDMLAGNDNQVGGDAEDQPGNQMAGYDMRLRSPWRALPLAFYTQWIGEDEAGNLPSKFIGQFGLEGWASTRLGALRVRAEYHDTACSFGRQQPEFNCAYRNGLYPQGYTYRGRIIGHSLDNDGRMYSLGVILTTPGADVLSLTIRRVEINRDGAGTHAISAVPVDFDNVELRGTHVFGFGKVGLGVGYDSRTLDTPGSDDVRGFVTWQQGF